MALKWPPLEFIQGTNNFVLNIAGHKLYYFQGRPFAQPKPSQSIAKTKGLVSPIKPSLSTLLKSAVYSARAKSAAKAKAQLNESKYISYTKKNFSVKYISKIIKMG